MTLVVHRSTFNVTAEELYAFHQDVRNLAAISPPLPRFELLSQPGDTAVGDLQVFRLSIGPFGVRWTAKVTRLVPGRLLEDTQESGPFLRWRHQHRVAPDGNGSRLTDVVAFRAIPTPLGEFVEYFAVRPGIKAMFMWRHWKTRGLLPGRAR